MQPSAVLIVNQCSLDRLELQTRTRRIGQFDMRWLSKEVIHARKLWRLAEDVSFIHAPSKTSNVYEQPELIHECRSSFFCDKVSEAENNPKLFWKAICSLLNPGSSNRWLEGFDTNTRATGLHDYFANKVKLIKDAIRIGINSSIMLLLVIHSAVITNKMAKF